jgi:hypothetical protein
MRDAMEMGELAEADLVQDLARIRIAVIVALSGLKFGKLLERAAGESRIDHHILQANDQAVAAEKRHEPWHSGRGHPDIVRHILVVEPERAHIRDRLPIEPLNLLIGAGQRSRLAHPFLMKRIKLGLARVEETGASGGMHLSIPGSANTHSRHAMRRPAAARS